MVSILAHMRVRLHLIQIWSYCLDEAFIKDDTPCLFPFNTNGRGPKLGYHFPIEVDAGPIECGGGHGKSTWMMERYSK
jgi:hypothetical protein